MEAGSETPALRSPTCRNRYFAANMFNEGWQSVLRIMNILGIPVGFTASNYAEAGNNTRISNAEFRISSAARATDIAHRVENLQKNIEFEKKEELLYAAGIAG